MRVRGAAIAWLLAGASIHAQAPDPGKTTFEQRCALCHGADGNGGDLGPAITLRLSPLDDQALAKVIREGLPLKGMPPNAIPDSDLAPLVKFLRTIQREAPPIVRKTVRTGGGRMLEGQLLGEGFEDLQLLTDDKRVHLLRRQGDAFRAVTSSVDWPTYNGDPRGNRYTTLSQIDKKSVARLAPRWIFGIPDAGLLQMTPLVVDGIMYVTAVNECYALDAGSGRQLWRYKRPRTKGVVGAGANRGVALAGERVFM